MSRNLNNLLVHSLISILCLCIFASNSSMLRKIVHESTKDDGISTWNILQNFVQKSTKSSWIWFIYVGMVHFVSSIFSIDQKCWLIQYSGQFHSWVFNFDHVVNVHPCHSSSPIVTNHICVFIVVHEHNSTHPIVSTSSQLHLWNTSSIHNAIFILKFHPINLVWFMCLHFIILWRIAYLGSTSSMNNLLFICMFHC